MEQVIFYTTAYNAEKTLQRTIQSILEQTDPNWIWYLLDNGSADRTYEIIRQAASKDPRIVPLHNDQNNQFHPGNSCWDIPKRLDNTDWFCWLDADDTYSPSFLEEMLAFARVNRLEMAACGTVNIQAQTGASLGERILPQDLFLSNAREFDSYFPFYYQFIRPTWAKLFSASLIRSFDFSRLFSVFHGWDTLYSMEMLRNAGRFGVLARPLHQYYISPKSVSYQWNPSRTKADQILYQMACSFLIDKCGFISPRNRNFLQTVYSHAVSDTLHVIQSAALSPSEKLREYRTIATHPITLTVYRECTDESVPRGKAGLILHELEAGAALGKQDDIDLRASMQLLLPRCGQAVNAINAQMFSEDPTLLQALLQDDADAMMEALLERMRDGREVKQYDVAGTIHALAVEKPLLCQIDDAVFLRRYGGIYWKVWKGDHLAALDEMSGLLLENKARGGQETFLTLFISLAALENQASAFIFGKLQLAGLYLRQGHRERCRSIVADLEEMGVEDDALEDLRRGWNGQ